MAKWNKIKDKLQADGQGPSSADWEAMQAKIAAQPGLNPASKKPIWITGVLAGGLGLLIGLSTWYFMPSSPKAVDTDLKQVPVETQGALSAEPSSETNKAANYNGESQDSQIINQNEENRAEADLTESKDLEEKLNEATSLASYKNEGEVDLAKSIASGALNDKISDSQGTQIAKTNEEEKPASNPNLEESVALSSELREEKPAMDSDPKLQEDLNAEEKPQGQRVNKILAEKAKKLNESSNTQIEEKQDLNSGIEGALTSQTEKPESKDENKDLASSIEQAPAAAEEFLDPGTGFKLSQLNISGNLLTDFAQAMSYAPGFQFDLEWQKGRQFFSTGLSYNFMNLNYAENKILDGLVIDSIFEQKIEQKEVLEIRRVWVIDSMFAGRYVNDTIRKIVQDTSIILNLDTNLSQTNIVKQRERRFYYAELPVVYGYRWSREKWSLGLAGGLALQQAISYSDEENSQRSKFGLSALSQLQLGWRLNQRWTLMGRTQIRYPLQESVFFQNKGLRYSFQMGVSYHW